jgi:hypothetical protein
MTDPVDALKRLALEKELQIVLGDGGSHVRVIGGLVVVHWWPYSRRRTAWADGAPRGLSNVTAKQVISLAVKGTLS